MSAVADPAFETPPEGSTDHEVAEGLRDGKYASPQKYGDFWLFDLRVTGTGAAYRNSIDEWAHRDPKTWLTPEFVQRCNGLAVVDGHPPVGSLNHDWFREHGIGSIVLPYIKGNEVWGVAKIFDENVAEEMQTTKMSTSPGVDPGEDSVAQEMNDGTKVLAEDLPLVLDHLAICSLGVWDKTGPAAGIRLDARKDQPVAEETEEEKKLKADAMELDAFRKADKARKDAEEEKERQDKARKDAEEADKEAEKAKADKSKKDAADAKRDSRKDRHSKHDAKKDANDCSRCDSEESEEAEEEKKREEKAKKDAAAVENVNAEEGVKIDARNDSVSVTKEQWAEVQAMQRQMAAMTRPLSNDDRDAIASAQLRADSAFQSVGDESPKWMQGEAPTAFRKRIMARAQKYSRFKDQTAVYFHDATAHLDGPALDLYEKTVYDDLAAYAKNPPAGAKLSGLREIKEVRDGKTYRRWIGDAKETWAPFTQPTRFFLKSLGLPGK